MSTESESRAYQENPHHSIGDRSAENPMRGIIAIVRRNEQFLIIQRSETVRAPLAWCFPGGEIEPDESEEDALKREMHEELNVDAQAVKRVAIRQKHDGRLVLYCWLAELMKGRSPTPNPLEVAQCRWLTAAEIAQLDGLLPGTLEIVTLAIEAEQ